MFDAQIRPWIDPPLNRFAKLVVRYGLTANRVTVVGFLIGLAGAVAISFSKFELALALILLNRIADGLDGAVARILGVTDLGGFLDSVFDTTFYSTIPFAFAIQNSENALPAAFLILSFVGTGGSFLAYAVIAAKRNLTTEKRGRKCFYYAVGLMEGAETILFFVLFCLFPLQFALLAWIFGGLCWLTTLLRIMDGYTTFRSPPPEPAS